MGTGQALVGLVVAGPGGVRCACVGSVSVCLGVGRWVWVSFAFVSYILSSFDTAMCGCVIMALARSAPVGLRSVSPGRVGCAADGPGTIWCGDVRQCERGSGGVSSGALGLDLPWSGRCRAGSCWLLCAWIFYGVVNPIYRWQALFFQPRRQDMHFHQSHPSKLANSTIYLGDKNKIDMEIVDAHRHRKTLHPSRH